MEAKIIDGEALAAKIKKGLEKEIEAVKEANKIVCLAAVQVGENPSSRVYIKISKVPVKNWGLIINYMNFLTRPHRRD